MRKATGSYRTYSSRKTATLIPEFAEEDLPLGRTAALVPGFAVKDLPLGRTLCDYDYCYYSYYYSYYYYYSHYYLSL